MNIQTITKKPGAVGAILRLAILAIGLLIGIIGAFSEIPSYSGQGFIYRFFRFFADIGACGMVGVFFWGAVKWCGFLGSRTLDWASAFWDSFIALNFFTLAVKACLWLSIVVAPFSVGMGVILIPVMGIVALMAKFSASAIAMLLLAVVCFLIILILACFELKKLNIISFKEIAMKVGIS